MKMQKILNKKSLLKSGLSAMDELEKLSSSISLAKGLLATLSLRHPSLWMKKCQSPTTQEHLRILLSDVMDEIWTMESLTTLLNERLNGPSGLSGRSLIVQQVKSQERGPHTTTSTGANNKNQLKKGAT